jgi:hypothetical protein
MKKTRARKKLTYKEPLKRLGFGRERKKKYCKKLYNNVAHVDFVCFFFCIFCKFTPEKKICVMEEDPENEK